MLPYRERRGERGREREERVEERRGEMEIKGRQGKGERKEKGSKEGYREKKHMVLKK